MVVDGSEWYSAFARLGKNIEPWSKPGVFFQSKGFQTEY
jgi:hypothetical protein